MKKNYLFTLLLTLCFSFLSFGQDLVITGGIDGPLPGGYPKGIELYAVNAIADITLAISSPTNNQEFESTVGDVTINFSIANFTLSGDDGSEMSDNTGDGYIVASLLSVNGVPIVSRNIFTDSLTFYDPDPGASYPITLELVDNSGASLSPKVEVSVTFSIAETVLSVGKLEIEGFATYPNPVSKGNFAITTNSIDVKQVSIFNVLGKQVISTSFSGTKSNIDVSSISSGIYILKVTENGRTATKKLVIR